MIVRRWIYLAAACCVPLVSWSAAPTFNSEDEWLVGRVIEDVRRIAQLAASKKVDWRVRDRYRIFSSAKGCTIKVGNDDIHLAHPWDVGGYADYIRKRHPSLRQTRASIANGLPYRLLTLTPDVIAAESDRVSRMLTRNILDPQAHEEAALIHGGMVLREASGRFYDPRVSLCRMTAHLAIARMLRSGGAASFSGQLAQVILLAKGGDPSLALERMRKMRVAGGVRGQPEWRSVIDLICRHDWRGKGGVRTLAERFAYTHAVLASSSGQTSKALVDSIYAEEAKETEICDWHRIFLEDPATRRYVIGRLPRLLRYETAEIKASGRYVLKGARVGAMIEALNQQPGYCVGPDHVGEPVVQVVDWGCFAAFIQRHLAHMFTFVPGREMIDRTYNGLRLYPLVLIQQKRNSLGLDRAALMDAAKLCVDRPEIVNEVNWLQLENLLEHAGLPEFSPLSPGLSNQYVASRWRKPPLLGYPPKAEDIASELPPARKWFEGSVIQCTSYRANVRRVLADQTVSEADLKRLRRLDPWDRGLAAAALAKLGDEASLADCDELVGDLAKYDLNTMRIVRNLVRNRCDDYLAILDRIAVISPDAYLVKALYLQQRGEVVKARTALADAQKSGVPAGVLARNSGWLIDHLSETRNTKKLEAVLAYVSQHGGYFGQLENVRYVEEQNGLVDAEKACLALQRKYAYQCPLLDFYVRVFRTTGKPGGLTSVPSILKEIQLSPAFKKDQRKFALARSQSILFPGGKVRYRPGDEVAGMKIVSATPQAQRVGLVQGAVIVAVNGYAICDVYQYYGLRAEIISEQAKFTWIYKGHTVTKDIILPFFDRHVKLALVKPAADTLAARIKKAEARGGDVKRLDLSGLGLTEFPADVLRFSKLEGLNLSNNPIRTLPPGVAGLSKLERFQASNCGLLTLPAEIGSLTSLRELSLSKNALCQLPAQIGQLKHLENLDLKDNQLTALPEEIGNLPKLRMLRLTGNALTMVPSTFSSLATLEKLSLGRNQLTEIPPELYRLPAVTDLLLFDNAIVKVPADIKSLRKLRRLDLRSNFIQDIPKEIGQLKALTRLQLGGNRFVRFPISILALDQLLSLDLGGNFLTTTPDEISSLKKLKKLVIAGNYLEALPESIKQLSATLTDVVLGNNDFTAEYLNALRREMKSTRFSEAPYEK